ncbi:MAG TPA: hypothetical protein VHV31_00555 [Nitrolancea sp.]|jgi:hypothetical protein|nr:hypothetical protein [Nitrolancea sp.]
MEFFIQIQGIAQLIAALKDSPAIAAPILQRALTASQAILAKNTNARTVPIRTGFLVNHFQWVMSKLQGYWYPTASYAPLVEFGTRPHRIEPKDKQALYWPGADHPVRFVNHPGTRPNPYMERIMAASQDDINATFGQAIQMITRAIAQGA